MDKSPDPNGDDPGMILFGSLSGMDRHSNWPGHPEGPGRLPAVEAGIRTAGLGDLLASLTGRPARRDELARVHSEVYLDALAGLDRAAEVGGGAARGLTVNVPMPPGSTGDAARLAMEKVVAPVAESFVPDWLLISAGFDAHRDDLMADLAWTAGDFADLTRDAVSLMPRPGRPSRALERQRSRRRTGSRPTVGSSRTTRGGFPNRAVARDSRVCSPPDNRPVRWCR